MMLHKRDACVNVGVSLLCTFVGTHAHANHGIVCAARSDTCTCSGMGLIPPPRALVVSGSSLLSPENAELVRKVCATNAMH